MRIKADTVPQYIANAPGDKRSALIKLRNTVKKNIPKEFDERLNYGMIGYVVPHSIFPKGYHCDPSLPLPFVCIAAQKNFIALYHMGIYGSPVLKKWFTDEYKKQVPGKLDMGKSCIRFKKAEHIPYDLIGKLMKKMTVAQWVSICEKWPAYKKKK